LLEDPKAAWPERTLFTHFGRWAKGESPDTAKYRQAAVRTHRWHLVSAEGARTPKWMLFDVAADPGETNNLALREPIVVEDLTRRFDSWWESLPPYLVNESAVGPAENPFKERYRLQFGKAP
jgi:arylsulfatase